MLRESDKEVFVKKFIECARQLLCNRMVIISRGIALPGGTDDMGNGATNYLFFKDDFENSWSLIKEQAEFVPNNSLYKIVVRRFRFLHYCKRSIKNVFDRGWRFFIRSVRRYFSILRRFNKVGRLELTFQDMFAVATSHFVAKGWGKAEDFKKLFVSL